jgi:hypothetical protein
MQGGGKFLVWRPRWLVKNSYTTDLEYAIGMLDAPTPGSWVYDSRTEFRHESGIGPRTTEVTLLRDSHP